MIDIVDTLIIVDEYRWHFNHHEEIFIVEVCSKKFVRQNVVQNRGEINAYNNGKWLIKRIHTKSNEFKSIRLQSMSAR